MPTLSLLVLRCRDIHATRAFYESLGFTFTLHAHGSGPQHFASESPAFVLELYPATDTIPPDTAGLGFTFSDLSALHSQLSPLNPPSIKSHPWGISFTLRDPDNRRVELQQSPTASQH